MPMKDAELTQAICPMLAFQTLSSLGEVAAKVSMSANVEEVGEGHRQQHPSVETRDGQPVETVGCVDGAHG